MAINIGPTLKRRREWARLTQQELVEHTRLDRSASYISALETGKTSPTLDELERLSRYFRLTVFEFLQECVDDSERRTSGSAAPAAQTDDRLEDQFNALGEDDRELALEFMELLARRRRGARS
jgi:transcriptional regulator with XRE-family HTH domain